MQWMAGGELAAVCHRSVQTVHIVFTSSRSIIKKLSATRLEQMDMEVDLGTDCAVSKGQQILLAWKLSTVGALCQINLFI